MAKSIKIKVTLEFNVDPDVWANEYGLDSTDAADDARNFIPTLVREYVGEMAHIQSGVVDFVKKD